MYARQGLLVRHTLSWLVLLGVTASVAVRRANADPGGCQAAEDTFVTTVSRTFTGGSAWTFSVYRATCEGLRILSASYRPAGGAFVQVLNSAALSQIHVPYLHGDPAKRFRDVSHHSLGLGAQAAVLAPAECEGTLWDGGRICIQNEDGGYAWKFAVGANGGADVFRRAEAVEVFMSSQTGEYNYINKWTFKDSGAIEVSLGLTGALELILPDAKYLPYGSRLNPQSEPTPRVGIAHQHNAYYRLDFDILSEASDLVVAKRFNPSTANIPNTPWTCSTPGQCAVVTLTPINVETFQNWSSTLQDTWIIRDKLAVNADGRNIGYELKPHVSGIWRGTTSSSEPWSASDLWVTRFKSCERLPIDNHIPHIPPSCAGVPVADHVQAMTLNPSQSTDGQDIVVWYVNRHLHYPRDEDEGVMSTEWMSFSIEPRNLFWVNPAQASTPPGSSAVASASTSTIKVGSGLTTSSVPPAIKR
jgi:primary-amine oxidase